MVIKKLVRVILIDDAKDSYAKLNEIIGQQMQSGKNNSNEMQLLRSIRTKIGFIKENPFYGDNIKKHLIPKKYNVSNLWRVEISNYWRMIYTIRGDEVEIICFVLDVVNHEEYNKLFGYKKQ